MEKYAFLRWPILVISLIINFAVFNLSYAQEAYSNLGFTTPNDTLPTPAEPETSNRVLSATEFSHLSSSMYKEDQINIRTEASEMSAAESRRLDANPSPTTQQPLNTTQPQPIPPVSGQQPPPSQLPSATPGGSDQIYTGFPNQAGQSGNSTPGIGQPPAPTPTLPSNSPLGQENQTSPPSGNSNWNIRY